MTTLPARLRRAIPRVGVSLLVLLAASVAIFASLNAARIRPALLAATHSSPEALADAVIDAMRAGDLDRLRTLALTREEFRMHVWPHLPASRPERNVPFDFVWNRLQQNSDGYLRQMLASIDRVPELRGVTFAGETSTYGDVTVHRETEFIVGSEQSEERRVRLIGSMIEQDGRWKVFSYVAGD